jgi:hypothetical protein
MLNVRAPASTVTGPYNDEKADEKESEKEPDPDLDPASLGKAFRFAAWSSVALVCALPQGSLIPTLTF